MVKPLPRERGAPIKYFYYKKYKNEDDARAANKRAHEAASAQIMQWHAQYAREQGRPPANYARGTNIPPPERPKFVPSKPKKKEKEKTTSSGSKRYAEVDERRISDLDREALETEQGKTEELHQRENLINQIMNQMREDAASGAISGSIGKVVKKEKRNWFQRNIQDTVVGDIVGRGLDIISRPADAQLGALRWGLEQNIGGMNPITTPTNTPDPTKDPDYESFSPEQKARAQADWQEAQRVRREGPIKPAVRGITGKEHYSIIPNYMRQVSAAREYEELSNWDRGLAIGAGLGTEIAIDPLNQIGAGVVQGVRKGRQAAAQARAAEEIIESSNTASKVTAAASDIRRSAGTASNIELVQAQSKVSSLELDIDDLIRGGDSLDAPSPELAAKVKSQVAAKAELERLKKLGKPSTELVPVADAPGPSAARQLEESVAEQTRRLLELEQAELRRTQTVSDVRRASPGGYKALKNEVSKQAVKVQNLRNKAASGRATPTLDAEVEKLAELHRKLSRADKVREATASIPVGSRKVKSLEQRASTLQSRIDELTPLRHIPEQKKTLARTQAALRTVQKQLDEAKIAERTTLASNTDLVKAQAEVSRLELDIDDLIKAGDSLKNPSPELAAKLRAQVAAKDKLDYVKGSVSTSVVDEISRLVEELSTGAPGTVTPKTVEAVKSVDQSIQDQIIALMRENEPQFTKGADPAKQPANKLIGELDETGKTSTVSPETVEEARRIIENAGRDRTGVDIAQAILDDLEETGRTITKAEGRALLSKELLDKTQELGVQQRAAAATDAKIKTIRETDPTAASAERRDELFNESLAEEIMPTMETADRILTQGLQKRFTIRFAGSDLGEFAPIGRALRAAYMPFELTGKHLGGTRLGGGFAKSFRMGSHFPGFTEDLRRAAESSGIVTHSEFTQRIRKTFTNNISRSEARQITDAIEHGYTLDGRLGELQALAMKEIEDLFNAQAAVGKYPPGAKNNRYVYHYYKSNDRAKIKAFKDDRTAALRGKSQSIPSIKAARAAGLKPEDRIDDILIMHHRDYVRDLQRANFRQQVASNYGVLTDNAAFANQMGLVPVKNSYLNKMFADEAATKKATWYLPPEIHETFRAMDRMMEIGANREANVFLEGYNKFIRGFKTSATVANPANWVNNTIGDFFLNYMDGVRSPMWYRKAERLLRLGSDDIPSTVRIGGVDMDGIDLVRQFKTKAPAGGFIRTEGTAPGRLRLVRGTQNMYEAREEWVRLAHFLHAMDDEMFKARGRVKNVERATDIAAENAARRVAKWNIDYTGITPFERQIRKWAVPFYTFMRKATPLMLEAMVVRPGRVNHYARTKRTIEEQALGVGPIKDDGTVWPFWALAAGALRMGEGGEPWFIRDNTPLYTPNRLFAGDEIQDPARNVLNMFSPPLKALYEVPTKTSIFNDQPITNWDDYLLQQIPTANIAARASGQQLSATDTNTPERSGAEMIFNLFGIPLSRNTYNRQRGEIYRRMGNNDEIFSQVNEALAESGLSLTKSTSSRSGEYYVLKNERSGQIIRRFRDYNVALREASRLAGSLPQRP